MQQTELSGILLMDKPQGFTSHDVVAKLRGILHTRKIGHGGTLDPLATGVLPVFIGGATKAADFAAAQDKEYVAGFTLGYCTDTQDVTGEIVQTGDRIAAEYAVKRAVRGFVGPQQQIPPMYSAVKVNGQKLYDLARKGREVERPARDIIVHEMELLDFDENAQKGTLRCVVSKGTYVRTLVNDLGEKLGTLAVLHSLVRTRSGAYPLDRCRSFEDCERATARCSSSCCRPTACSPTVRPSRSPLRARSASRAAQSSFRGRQTACPKPQARCAVCTMRDASSCSVRSASSTRAVWVCLSIKTFDNFRGIAR